MALGVVVCLVNRVTINVTCDGAFESVRSRLQIIRECPKSGRRLVVLEGFGKPARACSPGAQLGGGIFRRWHGFPHYRSGGVLAPLSHWRPDDGASDGACSAQSRALSTASGSDEPLGRRPSPVIVIW